MPEYTLKLHRYDPESGDPAYWEDYDVDLSPTRVGARRHPAGASATQDGSIGDPLLVPGRDLRLVRRAHQRQVRAGLQHQDRRRPPRRPQQRGIDEIVVEPMGNCPVIKDLIVDMDAVHWKKVQRVVPWLLPEGDPPEREYIVPAESMIDVTQSMACIHCGACVGACLSLEVDPEFVGPAALAKAYRFVGDPRDAADRGAPARPGRGPARHLRLHALLPVRRGLPEGRRADVPDHAPAPPRHAATSSIKDRNNGYGHEKAFVGLIEKYGTLHESQLLPRSFGDGSLIKSQIKPAVVKQLPATCRRPCAA